VFEKIPQHGEDIVVYKKSKFGQKGPSLVEIAFSKLQTITST